MIKELVAAVIIAESSGNPSAVSPVGAQGLMQLMPIGVEEVRQQFPCMRFVEWKPFDPEINIMFGTLLLKFYLTETDGNVREALVLYNSGYRGLRYWRAGEPFKETSVYVERVCKRYGKCLNLLKVNQLQCEDR